MNKKIKELFEKPFIHITLIIFVGILAYSNTLNVPFQFDDKAYIVENPAIRNFQLYKELPKVEVEFPRYLLKSRFVGFYTFALTYKLHDLDVIGYHIFNLAIHIITALLVYRLIVLTFKILKHQSIKVSERQRINASATVTLGHSDARLIALFAGLFFVSHPIQTQAVTYIWQRVTSLATMFYLLSVVMYVKARLETQSTELRAQNSEHRTRTIESLKSLVSLLCSGILVLPFLLSSLC